MGLEHEAWMNTDVARLIEACEGVKTLVIGDAILDGYAEGDTRGLCREAPVPIVRRQPSHLCARRSGQRGG